MQDKMKVAIVGAGGVSESHVDGWKQCAHAEVVAVVDINEEQAKQKANKWGIKGDQVYQSLDALVRNNRPDLVDICTPEHIHKLMAIQAIELGLSVFSEKIMAANLQDGFEMMSAAKRTGNWAGINYNYHYYPCFSLLKDITSADKHGRIREVYVQSHSFCFHHVLETLLWIFGVPTSISADGTERHWPQHLVETFKVADHLIYIPSESLSARLSYENGLNIHINASLYQSLNHLPFGYTCVFDSGEVLQATGLDWERNMVGKVSWLPEGDNLIDVSQYQERSNIIGFRASIKTVAQHFMSGKRAPSNWEDGWNVMVVDHAIYLAGLNKTNINVTELKSDLERTMGNVIHG
ncbi:putative dehydrogenase [Pullulanibacillus pueri]|uniref:Gfo/Idh/MocA-like oxidoreductase N-terminal domain-containing protein n=1 Tax=Pullulanibacillus pueri TaxID=1437324 RepID=A0A8J3EN04_9BACL|nr:Gfo/Idh/MocA family oxidoreductase [Pullulanibacillus pueri]MBM7683879.1 putative dehydrogenase [Pullulanibacillus pueri]GGH84644.1 hypothetical protein GCM10007096_28200 [Pullulanibacillus pueri]